MINCSRFVFFRWCCKRLHQPGIRAALGAALLFGAGTPLAKQLLDAVSPWLLAGLLYLGSGVGLTLYRILTHAPAEKLARADLGWLVGAIVSGGVIAPVLLMLGLTRMPASGASLLLNAESVFTALLAWFLFKEHFGFRIMLGMAAIVTGAVVLSWPEGARFDGLWPALAVLGACFAWGVDNNLTRQVSLSDASWIASVKGLVAGSVNLALALAMGTPWPPLIKVVLTLTAGFFAYGISLTLFVVSLRHLGTARTGAYFSVAPFFGAVLAVAMGEAITASLLLAGVCMAWGVWLHLTEQHEHEHTHEALEHVHEFLDDDHHRDIVGCALGNALLPHRHKHYTHTHPHFPDAHHRHDHK